MIRGSIVALMLAACAMSQAAPRVSSAQAPPIRFAFTSDAHYGLTRSTFRGHTDVDAHVVNAALVDAINHVGPPTARPSRRPR